MDQEDCSQHWKKDKAKPQPDKEKNFKEDLADPGVVVTPAQT